MLKIPYANEIDTVKKNSDSKNYKNIYCFPEPKYLQPLIIDVTED